MTRCACMNCSSNAGKNTNFILLSLKGVDFIFGYNMELLISNQFIMICISQWLFFFRFVLYFSALCNDAKEGKNLLRAAINDFLKLPGSEITESGSPVQGENAEVKPTLLWSALYIQELTTVCFSYCIFHIYTKLHFSIISLFS